MASRPITDLWLLARPKVPYYGAYPNGFLERAIPAVGASTLDPVLHVCGGHAKRYPNRKWVRLAVTVDIDPKVRPTFCGDARDDELWRKIPRKLLRHVIVDPPYSDDDAQHYRHKECPRIGTILNAMNRHLPRGATVGVLHYYWTRPPEGWRQVMLATVVAGYYNKARCFGVFQKA